MLNKEPETLGELCEREIVKIRTLTLKDDQYTRGLLGEAVGSPTGITLCVEARMRQIADLQAEVKRLQIEQERLITLNARLAKRIQKLKRTADLDDGFIDFLTTKDDES